MENITTKTETMKFLGLDLVRSKIIVEHKCLQQVRTLTSRL